MNTITINAANKLLTQEKKPIKLHISVLRCFDAHDGYILHNKMTLLFKTDSVLYIPFSEVSKYLLEIDKVLHSPPSPEEILLHKSKYLVDFANNFEMDYGNPTLNSVKKVDTIYRKLINSGIRDAQLFLPLVIYLGEVLVNETKGNWKIDQGKEVEHLVIEGSNGKLYDPFFCVLKILTGAHKRHSFYAAIEFQLNPIVLHPANPAILNDFDKIERIK